MEIRHRHAVRERLIGLMREDMSRQPTTTAHCASAFSLAAKSRPLKLATQLPMK